MPLSKETIERNRTYFMEPGRLVEFGRYFFPGAIRGGTPDVHYKLCNWLYAPDQFIYITFPRGRAKTTWVRIYIVHRILYNRIYDMQGKLQYLTRYLGYKSNTETKAKSYCQWILDQFEWNKKLIAHYGNMKDDKLWSTTKAKFTNGIILMPFGANQSMRGGLEGDWRYTDQIHDDLDDLEEASSPTIMEKHWSKLKRDDIKALDTEYGRLRLLGTVINKDCCIQKAIDDEKLGNSRWKGVTFQGLDENGRSIWEERFPTERVLAERQEALDRGDYAAWLAEEMNVVADEESRVIKREWFQYFDGYVQWSKDTGLELVIEKKFKIDGVRKIDIDDKLPRTVQVNAYLGIDPAGELSQGDSDFWVLFTLLQDADGYFYDFDYIRERMTTTKLMDYLFDDGGLYDTYHYKRGKFESNAGFSATQSVVTKEMIKKRKIFGLAWVKNTENKKQRITATLEPPWKMGAIFHRRHMDRLEEEAENHPNIHHEDVLDAKQMAMSIANIRPQPKTPQQKRAVRRGKRITDEELEQRKRSWTVI